MQTYLVGGAIRDRLLGLPAPYEKDWVVVNGTPDQLKSKGYKKVGKSFPVFIDPETGEEYALARRERKNSSGYHGFEFDAGPEISLEEDLSRRDLTINAIAEDEDGTLRTLEVDLDLSSNDQSKLPSKTVIDKELEKFASLQDQIHVKYNDYENYGDKIVKIAS